MRRLAFEHNSPLKSEEMPHSMSKFRSKMPGLWALWEHTMTSCSWTNLSLAHQMHRKSLFRHILHGSAADGANTGSKNWHNTSRSCISDVFPMYSLWGIAVRLMGRFDCGYLASAKFGDAPLLVLWYLGFQILFASLLFSLSAFNNSKNWNR